MSTFLFLQFEKLTNPINMLKSSQMPDNAALESKKITRRRAKASNIEEETTSTPLSPKVLNPISEAFTDLINKITQYRSLFEKLQKEIEEIKLAWLKEQKDREVERSREKESYDYEIQRQRKLDQDAFNDKKATWEKELQDQKDTLAKDKKELEQLRILVANFDKEKENAIKEATDALLRQLTSQFETASKLKEQEVKSEKEILSLKIANLTAENSRQSQEIAALKQALDEATRQVKEIALKVIEGRTPPTPFPEKPAS